MDEDEEAIARDLSDKLVPLLAQALGGGGGRDETALRAGRVDPIVAVVRAFGFSEADAREVVAAWQGLAYCQRSFAKAVPILSRVVGWLNSPKAVPKDVRKRSFEADQFAMAARGLAIGFGQRVEPHDRRVRAL